MARVARSNELLGFKECREALQEMPEMIQRLTVRGPLIEAARTIQSAVESRAPVSNRPGNPTPGSLKASGKSAKHRKGAKSLDTVAVIFADPAAVPHEYGTTKQAADPFFRPGVDAVEGQVIARFAQSLKDEVEKAARGLAEASRLAK